MGATSRSDEGRPRSVDALVRSMEYLGLPHPLLVEAAREAVAAGRPDAAPALAQRRARSLLMPVINATGVLLHTNLGRAPVPHHQDATAWNLEIDLETGARGSRHARTASLVTAITGAEDALVVNNGAGAVLLALSVLAAGRAVVVSRGELVEIGGGFRIPEVLGLSGARLYEVGTTNRTRLEDYRVAVTGEADVAAVLKVHQSNYRIVGFTEAVEVAALVSLGVPVVADLGSGLLDANVPWLDGPPPAWLAGEPAVRQTLQAGVAAVTFSGDKLLGGPQAGIIAGRADVVAACALHPLARALRPGSMTLVALQETLLAYLRRDGQAIPFWRMASAPADELCRRAAAVLQAAGSPPGIVVSECESVAGGGSVPGLGIPSFGIAIRGDRRAVLRAGDPPIVAHVRDGRTVIDLRSVDPVHDPVIAKVLSTLDG